jgi:hypothetical protein
MSLDTQANKPPKRSLPPALLITAGAGIGVDSGCRIFADAKASGGT